MKAIKLKFLVELSPKVEYNEKNNYLMAKRSAAALLGATANSRASGWCRQIWKNVKYVQALIYKILVKDNEKDAEYLSLYNHLLKKKQNGLMENDCFKLEAKFTCLMASTMVTVLPVPGGPKMMYGIPGIPPLTIFST